MTLLDDLFLAETMITQVETFADQAEERSFLSVYEGGEQINPLSDTFTFDEVTYSRGLAPITGTQSPSKAHKPLNTRVRAAQIYAIKEHVDLPMNLLAMLRGAGQTMPDPAGWLRKNLSELTNRVQRTRNYWAALSFYGATVNLSAFPNADAEASLPTLTYPVATLDSAAPWSTFGTKIRSEEINPLMRKYKQNVGFRPGIALASDTVEGFITGNTEISNPVDHVPSLAQRKIESNYLNGGSIMNLGGLDFNFVRDDYVTEANQETADDNDAAATVSDVITDPDLVAVLPPRGRWGEAFAQALGRVFVPTGAITSAAVGNPFDLVTESRGWSSYIELILNPIGLRLHVGWHGNFIQKIERAVLVYDTTP